MLTVSVINYGVGNLRNVKRGLEKAGVNVIITNDPKVIAKTDAIVLPGVGAFAEAMKNVTPLLTELNDVVKSGRPVLGICLGLQLLFSQSQEGGLFSGLDYLKGEVIKLPTNVKLPHMGWNTVELINSNKFTENIPEDAWMYFVHTYVPQPLDRDVIVAQTEYGIKFPSIIAKKNMFATQFHPEKSGIVGFQMLKNFTEIIKR